MGQYFSDYMHELNECRIGKWQEVIDISLVHLSYTIYHRMLESSNHLLNQPCPATIGRPLSHIITIQWTEPLDHRHSTIA